MQSIKNVRKLKSRENKDTIAISVYLGTTYILTGVSCIAVGTHEGIAFGTLFAVVGLDSAVPALDKAKCFVMKKLGYKPRENDKKSLFQL